jgi:transcriptional regulator with XRE-family HTH domain
MDVGMELRRARERRGISLQQLSQTSKISLRALNAIEADDIAALPAPVYTKAFVKTYARETGLDADDVAQRYMAQFEPEASDPAEIAPVSAPADDRHDLQVYVHAILQRGRGTAALVLGMLALVVFLASRTERQPSSAAESRGRTPVMTAGLPPAAAPQPVATSGTTSARVLHIEIAPTAPCWVQAVVGGERRFAATLNPGDRRTLDAVEVTLRVGDPAAFAFTIDGKRARVAGTPGRAVSVRIGSDNYSQFVAR